jgi:HD-GYP domain-containing protein (c-di-GMP phosphodiesterase class II)/anti-sigma regulatory factor (Ser/Thr protein kinase)
LRDINWFTGSLITFGLVGLLIAIPSLSHDRWIEWLLIIALVIYLDLFPIKLFSGDEYIVGTTIGSLYILNEIGVGAASLAIMISTLISFIYRFGSLSRVNWIRYLITNGMYFVSLHLTLLLFQLTKETNLFICLIIMIVTFELTNTLLLSGIYKSLMGTPIFQGFYVKLKELIIPVLVSMIVLARIVYTENLTQFTFTIFYTAFFLSIIIFFSRHFIKQVQISQNTTKKFIEVLETRIAPQQSGHGTRVGEICQAILELVDYPKKLRHTLIQVATIHDIGKSLLPAHLLQKRGALTLSEEKVYKSHSEKGAEIVKSIFNDESISDWVLYHHEHWDGNGFPRGLKCNEIPFEARLISLCNQLDYIMNRHHDDATVLELIQEMSGNILDPNFVCKIDQSFIAELRENLPTIQVPFVKEEDNLSIESEMDAKCYIGQSIFVRFETGQLHGLGDHFQAEKEIRDLAIECQSGNQSFIETITAGSETYEVHFKPMEDQVLIFIHDVSPMLHYREKLTRDNLESFRDIIFRLSDEKIQLYLEKDELIQHLGESLGSYKVVTAMDVPESRRYISSLISHYPAPFLSKLLLALSEAATNMIKHSTGGTVQLFHKEKEHMIQVLVTDTGSGIPINEIPKTILVSGYSSKRSLGKGFLLIQKSADKTRIYTSPKGTSILMEFKYPKIEDNS